MKDTPQTEVIWLWATMPAYRSAIGLLAGRAIEEGWKPKALGQEIMKVFYAELPIVGRRTFWLDILDQCMEHVDWTQIAKRVLIEVGSAA